MKVERLFLLQGEKATAPERQAIRAGRRSLYSGSGTQ